MSQAIDRTKSEDTIRDGEIEHSLFSRETPVRVSDLIGDIRDISNATPPDEPSLREWHAPIPAPPVRNDGPLRLDWYDWAVIALFVSSFIAGFACLLAGR